MARKDILRAPSPQPSPPLPDGGRAMGEGTGVRFRAGGLRDSIPPPLLPQRLAADAEEVRGPSLVAAGVGEGVLDLLLLHLEQGAGTGFEETFGLGGIDRASLGQDQAALQGVAELAEVARPGVLQHPGAGARR